MARFGRKEQAPKSSSKKKGGFARAIGLQTEVVASQEQLQDNEMTKKVIQAWVYLRGRIDAGIQNYYKSGDFAAIEEVVEEPALGALKQQLYLLRSQSIHWQQRGKRIDTNPNFVVGEIETTPKGQPTKFTLRERFNDYSVHNYVVDANTVLPHAVANGEERVIEVVVNVIEGRIFRLHSVRQVRDAVIG
jgi:hypothetical protein